MPEPSPATDVFLSRKSADAPLARQLYQFLTNKGLTVFESDETLPRMGNSDYRKAIDQALDQCRHLIVVGSRIEYIQSAWVEAEWGFFVGEKRASRKPGNLLSVITHDLAIADLPPSLRNYEVISFDPENFERIYAYVGTEGYTPGPYKPPWQWPVRWLFPGLAGLLLLVIAVVYTYQKNQPFDLTIFAKPAAGLRLHPDYPAFAGGELAIYFDNKEEKKQTLANGEVVLKQLPASLLGRKVAVSLRAKDWKVATDSVVIARTMYLPLIPDGNLSTIAGSVRTKTDNTPVANARITVDTQDTTLTTDAQGVFDARLPYRLQKDHYRLDVRKVGFKPYDFIYYPKSVSPDVLLESN